MKKLDDLGIADNTIVMYSTDNGAETFTWPDGGTTPFRGEKATNWEGGYRVPALIRWPGTIKPGTVYNDVFAHEDMLPTILAAAGVPDVKETLLKGYAAGSNTFKVHLDGYDLAPYFKGEAKEAPRKEFLYWNDDGKLVALRYNRWKLVFSEQRSHGSACGRSRSWTCVCRRSTTCAPTRSSARATNRSATRCGGSSASFCWCRRRPMSPAGWRVSKNSRRGRNPRASASTR